MRILTLGALIVATGTLAALPFRRYQAIPQSSPPTDATGPTQSTLFGLDFETVVKDPAAEAELPSLALPQVEDWERTQRQIRMPLTYDDLAIPLTLPPSFHDKFSATARSQATGTTETTPGLRTPEPRMEPAVVATESSSARQGRAGSLLVTEPASTTSGETKPAELISATEVVRRVPEPLPQAPPRPRHWIHQP